MFFLSLPHLGFQIQVLHSVSLQVLNVQASQVILTIKECSHFYMCGESVGLFAHLDSGHLGSLHPEHGVLGAQARNLIFVFFLIYALNPTNFSRVIASPSDCFEATALFRDDCSSFLGGIILGLLFTATKGNF